MFLHILISYCFLVVVNCVLVNNTTSTRKTDIKRTPIVPSIDISDSIEEMSTFELLGGGIQGDMLFPKGFDLKSTNKAKGVAISRPRNWPNGVVPYDLSAISSTHRNIVLRAMQRLMYDVGTPIPGRSARQACIYFRPRQLQDKSYLRIRYGGGCGATVGYWANYVSTMTLHNRGCFYRGTIQHELMHILGFYHEQSRPDRDSYITVNYNNIARNAINNFDKFQWGISAFHQNTPYDYGSIMHYSSKAFSINNRPTIVPKRSNVIIGQRKALSAIDIVEIRKLYRC